MAEIGHFALCLAWLLALIGTIAGMAGGVVRTRSAGLLEAVRRATLCVGGCLGVAIAALGYSFVTDDYTLQYVWQYSNQDMPWIYKITAIWGGMDGSMLLWCFLGAIFSALAAWQATRYPRVLVPWLLGFLNSTNLFFLTVTLFLTNPFRYINAHYIPPDGRGLNPLLQNEYMAAHPPTLYLGFTGLAVPYAFCMAALCAGHLSNDWVRLTRRWTLIAWSFLTTGIVLGGHWAYIELGWGGFWAWDPVENASFLPWLGATAFLHSIMVQERKGMLKIWNLSLVVLTYALTVFGTFLTRSGLVQSVHAFASTNIGWVFLAYLGVILVSTAVLLVVRRSELKPERRIESLFSREAVFLLNNLVLLSICFSILWGVMFPVFSDAFTGQKQTVGIPFFNAVNVPLFLLLIFLMGVGPVIAWKRSSVAQLRKLFLVPFVGAFLVAVLLVWAGITEFYPVLSYSLCFFALMTIVSELNRGLAAQSGVTGGATWSASNVNSLMRRQRVRYGAHLIHFGVLVMTVAITASMAHKIEREFSLKPGDRFAVGRFSIELGELSDVNTSNYQGVRARAIVHNLKDDSIVTTLQPEMRFYPKNEETTTEVALHMSPREDLYLVLAGIDEQGTQASFKVFVNPLQVWLWFGALIMVAGGITVAWPSRKSVRQAVENTQGAQVA